MHALLGKTGVVNDPPACSAEIHVWHDPLADPTQNLRIRPFGLGHKVMQSLMSGTSMQRIYPGRHGLPLLGASGSIKPVQ
jgi:hypothetical protein